MFAHAYADAAISRLAGVWQVSDAGAGLLLSGLVRLGYGDRGRRVHPITDGGRREIKTYYSRKDEMH